jgi:hypothetical protein
MVKLSAHEMHAHDPVELEIALYGQKAAWKARNAQGLQNANEHLLTLIPRDGVEPEPSPSYMSPEQELLGAIEYQRQALRDNNQVALEQANEMMLAAQRELDATSPDKR